MTYAAILFVVLHLYVINDNTISLAMQIESVQNKIKRGPVDSNNEILTYTAIPRKITLFRCVMEKKLGIDWEHCDE